jgi:hypothetical protein
VIRVLRVFPLVLVVMAFGCEQGGVPVTGTVTRGGAPLSAATIAFEPKAGSGTTGPGASADVRDGAFLISADRHLTPGTYLVRVSPLAPNSGDDLKTAPPQFKPWETIVELKSGNGPIALELPAKD